MKNKTGLIIMIKNMIFGALLLLAGSAICLGANTSRAAETTYIKEVTVRSGESADEELTKDDYTVLYPAVAKDTWIGYRTTGSASEAITDICLGGDGQREKDGASISYEKISNHISGQTLYYTKNSAAGEPLMGLHFVTEGEDKEAMPLMNDGAETVRRTDGEIAKLDAGTDKGFLIQIKKNIWKPYISDIKVATAGSKKDALMKLGALGCDYYIDENASSKGYTMIGYTKTDDEKEAITDAIVMGEKDAEIDGYELVSEEKVLDGYLYMSVDTEVGNPLLDIDAFENPEEEKITESEWVEFESASGNANVTTPYYHKDDRYNKMSENESLCELRPCNLTKKAKALGLVVISGEEGLDAKKSVREERISQLTEPEDPEDGGIKDGETEDGETGKENPESPAPEVQDTTKTTETTEGDTKLNPEIQTDEPTEVKPESEFGFGEETAEENTQLVGATEDAGAGDTTYEDVGTVAYEKAGFFSSKLTIILIAFGILIPIVAILIKRRIDHIGQEESKDS